MLQRAEVRCTIETFERGDTLVLCDFCCSARKCAALLRQIGTKRRNRRHTSLQRAEVRCSIETSGGEVRPMVWWFALQRAEVRCTIATAPAVIPNSQTGLRCSARKCAALLRPPEQPLEPLQSAGVAARGSALLY